MNIRSMNGSYDSLTAGFVLVAIAVAILIAGFLNEWWVALPLLLIECGAYAIILGTVVGVRKEPEGSRRYDSPYFIFWGTFLAIIGSLWLLNAFYPENLLYIVVAFLVWLGLTIIVLSLRRRAKA
jgi:apolipoprotein N-acyltransferase